MLFNKPPLSIADQVARLSGRGLVINDVPYASNILQFISYYRLRAYTYPFQDNNDPNHPFIRLITFEEIIRIYEFDRDLRVITFKVIERIEIALRTLIVYHFAMAHGSHWFEDPALYRNPHYFQNDLASLDKEIDRSDEEFIKHYKNTYSSPLRPPAWMSLEVATITTLSKLYQNLKLGPEKKNISRCMGLSPFVLENWMHVLSNVRNICAHHSRLYNRRLSQAIQLPTHTFGNPWLNNLAIDGTKMYAILCAIIYLLDRIFPTHDFRSQIRDLFILYPEVQPSILKFPVGWENENFWTT